MSTSLALKKRIIRPRSDLQRQGQKSIQKWKRKKKERETETEIEVVGTSSIHPDIGTWKKFEIGRKRASHKCYK